MPNYVISTTDIITGHRLGELPGDVTYPHNMRYTLQWLVKPSPPMLLYVPDNIDAAFKIHHDLPSDLLLHYNYGAAAVKLWGHGVDILQNHPNIPRPTVSAQAPTGSTRTVHDRSITTQKWDAAVHTTEAGAGNVAPSDQPGDIMDSGDAGAQWDEDDVMLFFWGNTQAAAERHHRRQEEVTLNIEQWRRGGPSI
jgi:hypothetical protein